MDAELCQMLSKYIYIRILYIQIHISSIGTPFVGYHCYSHGNVARLLQFLFLATWADAVEQQSSINHKTFAVSNSHAGFWSNYSDVTRVFTPNAGLVKEIPLISGKSRLVKYYNLARYMGMQACPLLKNCFYVYASCCILEYLDILVTLFERTNLHGTFYFRYMKL